MNYKTIKAPNLKIGDIVSINTGYRPLDDEWCKILAIKESQTIFDTPTLELEVLSESNEKFTYDIEPKYSILTQK